MVASWVVGRVSWFRTDTRRFKLPSKIRRDANTPTESFRDQRPFSRAAARYEI